MTYYSHFLNFNQLERFHFPTSDIFMFRMTLLITIFLVLVNIFNTITTNIPKAEGLTAIEAFVIVCVLFVFGALMGKIMINETKEIFLNIEYCTIYTFLQED